MPDGHLPSDQANQHGCKSTTVHMHSHHLLLLLSLKADIYFTVSYKVKGYHSVLNCLPELDKVM